MNSSWIKTLARCQECQNHGPICLRGQTQRALWNAGKHCVFDIRCFLKQHHNVKCLEVATIFWCMTLVLRKDNTKGKGLGLLSKAGFAGSSAQYILELLASREAGKLCGRWAILALQAIIPSETGIQWCPGDADYFITGENFFSRVDVLIMLLREVVEAHGKTLTVEKAQPHLYACPNRTIWTVNVRIQGLDTKLSFVESPECKNMKEVLENFDVSVAKVMYDCKGTGMLLTRSDVLSQIKGGVANVKDFEVGLLYPTLFQCRRITSTLNRMNKYGERGYMFLNYPKLNKEP